MRRPSRSSSTELLTNVRSQRGELPRLEDLDLDLDLHCDRSTSLSVPTPFLPRSLADRFADGVSLFIPTIINGLGYTANQANLLSIPIFVWACGLSLLAGYIGDRIGKRSIFNFICFSIAIVGCIMLICSTNSALSYVGLWFVGTGA